MVITSDKCDYCGKENTECLVIKKRFWVFFVTDVAICQTCVSRAFKLFSKGK